jgi:uncharacterized protein (DUF1697 family)
MTVYIALLRGINVGGHCKIAMVDLKKLFGELGFHNASTYIQSGNVVFKSEVEDPFAIEKTIKRAIKDRFSLEVEVIAKSLEELSKIIDANPFGEAGLGTGEKVYFTLLSKKPEDELVDKLGKADCNGDEIAVKYKTAYILCRNGYSNTPYNNNFIERILNVSATSRNLETMKKLAELGATVDEHLASNGSA